LSGKTVTIDGLSSTYTDVLVRMIHADGTLQTSILSPDSPMLTIAPSPTAWDTARTYFVLGVEHILTGIDHLLFVLALLLLIPNLRLLVETVTAFTVAHSITLAFAAFGWSNVPQQPVEALIALSIVIVAAEILNSQRGRRDFSIRYPWIIAFAFGLLHGFGFGGALREIGLPQNDVPMALLTFNLGVEAGQLMFIFAVLAVLAVTRRLFSSAAGMSRLAAAYGIGSIAAFWFVQRIAMF
jgi:hydrogenase/urease accessory protein HupE